MTLRYFAAKFRDDHFHQIEHHRAFWDRFWKMQIWRVPQLVDCEAAVKGLTACTDIAQLILTHGMAIVGDYVIMNTQQMTEMYSIGCLAVFARKRSVRVLGVHHVGVAYLMECVELVESWRAGADPRWPRFVGGAVWTGDDICDQAWAI
jgi:hypothetical protein